MLTISIKYLWDVPVTCYAATLEPNFRKSGGQIPVGSSSSLISG